MKNILVILIFTLVSLSFLYGQDDDTVVYKTLDEFVVNRYFQQNYERELKRVRKIYPMALKAKAIIDEHEAEIAKLSKKSQVKKESKKLLQFLKEEFTYSVKDLYTSEGRLLMQLIHRETGRTVDQLISEYVGGGQAFVYRNMAKMFDQNLRDTYDPKTKNFYTEIVIHDILTGTVDFNPVMDKMTKEAFKESMQEYREGIRRSKRIQKEKKKEAKAAKKEKKKEEKAKKNS